jgi:putative pyruvate formate lyase activating enzyme
VFSYGPHTGEESPISGFRGSGTIFFSGCNMRCQYCQNYEISQGEAGDEVDAEELAAIMLELQEMGCHNINLVTPGHVMPQILAALLIAASLGLRLPLVYNTGGYDRVDSLKILDGVVDVYMPYIKYASAQIGLHYSKVRNYPQANQAAISEMQRQVGILKIDPDGISRRGLLVRHLVLPYGLAGTPTLVRFLATEVSPQTYLNVMDQYHPAYLAHQYPKLNRRITNLEYQEAVREAQEAGLTRLDSD